MIDINKEKKVFILYSGKDGELVKARDKIKCLLDYENINWADYQDLESTPEKRLHELNQSIKGSETIILLISEKYFLSHYCQDEIRIINNKFNEIGFLGHVFVYSKLQFLKDNFYEDNYHNFIEKINKFIERHVKDKLSNNKGRKTEFEYCTETNRQLIEAIAGNRERTFVYTENNFNQLIRDVAQMVTFKQSTEGSKYIERLTQKKPKRKKKIFTLARGQGHHVIIVAHAKTEILDKESIQKSIHNGSFNTKHLYNSFEAVKLWKESMNNLEPKQESHHDKDREQLRRFLSSKFWENAKLNIDRVVELGVGTGEKTVKIIESLSTCKKDINVVLVDTSLNMIKESFNTIKGVNDKRLENIDGVDALDADFMNFDNEHKAFMQGADYVDLENRTAFFILGGTLCNLELDKFMKSIKNVMIEGDYLIIGIHIFEKELDEVKKDALDSYNLNTLKKIFSYSLSEFNVVVKELTSIFEKNDFGGTLKFNGKLSTNNKNIDKNKLYPLIKSIRYKLAYITSYFIDSKIGSNDGNGSFNQRVICNSDETAYIAFEYKGEDTCT